MTTKYSVKSIIIIALPLMAAFLAQRGMQFIDSVMMGWIGPNALAAGALGTSLFGTILLFCMGILSTIGIFIVRAKSMNDIPDIKVTMQHGWYLAIILSIPCMVIIWFIPSILLTIGENQQVVIDTALLLHGMVWGFPGFLLFLVLREFISAFSLTLIIMIVSIISIPFTFIANYILIYGKYHFPQLGIAGIGYGGSIIMWFMFLSLLLYSKKHAFLKEHLVIRPYTYDHAKLMDMLSIGIPSGTLFLLEAGMFLSTTLLMGYFGVEALAAHQIAMQCANVAYTLPVALSMATALQVSHAAAEKNYMQVQQTGLLSFGIVLFCAGLMAIIFVISSNSITNLFLDKTVPHYTVVYQYTLSFIKISALFLCFDALQSVANGALRGLRDTFIPMLFSLVCYWVLGVGGGYYLSMHTQAGASGIWYGLTLGLSSTSIILTIRFFKKLQVEKAKKLSTS